MASPGNVLEMRILGPAPDMLSQNPGDGLPSTWWCNDSDALELEVHWSMRSGGERRGEERTSDIPLSWALSEDWLGSCLTFLCVSFVCLSWFQQIFKLKSCE